MTKTETPKEGPLDDKTYEAIGLLLRGIVWHEQSSGRTPEHLAGQVRRAIGLFSPEIAAEVEQDGAARVCAERWETPSAPPEIDASKVGSAYSRTPEMQARYGAAVAAVARERDHREKNNLCVTITPQGPEATVVARAILELLQGASSVRCSMPEESAAENPYDGDSIEQLGELRDTLVIVQTSVLE